MCVICVCDAEFGTVSLYLPYVSAVYEEFIDSPRASLVYRVYAHHYHTRLLVTEISVERNDGDSGNLVIQRDDLSGGIVTDDIEFQTPDIYACGGIEYRC